MGLGIEDTPGVLSWVQGQDTPGELSWDKGLETLQACCHGIRDKTHYRRVVMGPGIRDTPGMLSWDQGQYTL
jgi:hypothetical protein